MPCDVKRLAVKTAADNHFVGFADELNEFNTDADKQFRAFLAAPVIGDFNCIDVSKLKGGIGGAPKPEGRKPHELPKEYLRFRGIQYRMSKAAKEKRAEEEAAAEAAAAAAEAASEEPKAKRRKESKSETRLVAVFGGGVGARSSRTHTRELRPKGGGLEEMRLMQQHTAQTIEAKRLQGLEQTAALNVELAVMKERESGTKEQLLQQTRNHQAQLELGIRAGRAEGGLEEAQKAMAVQQEQAQAQQAASIYREQAAMQIGFFREALTNADVHGQLALAAAAGNAARSYGTSAGGYYAPRGESSSTANSPSQQHQEPLTMLLRATPQTQPQLALGANVVVAPGATVPKAPSVGTSTKARLKQIDSLKSEGMITEAEYNEKRQAILALI